MTKKSVQNIIAALETINKETANFKDNEQLFITFKSSNNEQDVKILKISKDIMLESVQFETYITENIKLIG